MIEQTIRNLILNSSTRTALWLNIIDTFKLKYIAEIGVYKGEFAKEILDQSTDVAEYHLIDPWRHLDDWNKPANENSQVFENIYLKVKQKLHDYKSKVYFHRGMTVEVIDELQNEHFDFIYIDGDHSLKGILIDLVNAYEKIKFDGYIGGDDCDFNPYHHSTKYEPTLVFPTVLYFAEAVGAEVYLLPFNQFLLRKCKTRNFKVFNFTEKEFSPDMAARVRIRFIIKSHFTRILSKIFK
jgi:hypothetical protein